MIRVTNDKNSDIMYFENENYAVNYLKHIANEGDYYFTYDCFNGQNAYCLENDYTYIEFYFEEC